MKKNEAVKANTVSLKSLKVLASQKPPGIAGNRMFLMHFVQFNSLK